MEVAVAKSEREIDAELAAFEAAVLISVGSLIKEKASLDKITSEINKDIEEAQRNIEIIISGIAAVALSSLKKVKVVDKNAEISSATKQKIKDFISLSKQEFKVVLNAKGTEIISQAYTDISTNQPKEKIIAHIKKTLVSSGLGENNIRGLKTLIVTKSYELESLVLLDLSDELNINDFIYIGPNDSKNRSWCKSHVGKTLSKKEIEKWESKSWEGKKPGNPFIVRGGWNCRHNFVPKGEK